MRERVRQYPLTLECMGGLGDNIYTRPFVRAWATEEGGPCWVRTPWPQLFADLPNVRFSRPPVMRLRTQAKNMARTDGAVWSSPGPRGDRRRFQYRLERKGETILQEIERSAGYPAGQPFVFDLPDFGPSPIAGRIAVIRPATVRTEWANLARNPDPAYLAHAAVTLRDAGFKVVVVADVDDKVERIVQPLPIGDVTLIRGELNVMQLMALIQHAAVVVGGVGFIVPAAAALKTPAVIIGGGNGAHNAPRTVVDPRMDASRMRFILPDDYCMCANMGHKCDKRISEFAQRFARSLGEVAEC
jgi:hypothetical protein